MARQQFTPGEQSVAIDLTGQIFGRLIVLERAAKAARFGKRAAWTCRCSCGTLTAVTGKQLRRGMTRSCGCLQQESRRTATRTHGLRRSREYRIWTGMKTRCTNPREPVFKYYGGRGIAVCAEWMDSFEQFLADMGPCPTKLSLERRDNDKGYSPENCYWATSEQQANNKRTTRLIAFNGRTLSVAAWARARELTYECLYARVFTNHWPLEKALTTPAGHRSRWAP